MLFYEICNCDIYMILTVVHHENIKMAALTACDSSNVKISLDFIIPDSKNTREVEGDSMDTACSLRLVPFFHYYNII